jgi:4,5-dihydroxyphthalate decarboxylase
VSEPSRRNLLLTLAIGDYDHVRDLISGAVEVQGIDLTCLRFSVEETFFRFARYREWDISEFSLAKYCSLRASGDESITAIPVFPSRSFRHSAIFVRPDGPVDDPAALAGARIGVPEWTQTATVYARGALQHAYGLDLKQIQWFQGGVNQPGRIEGIALQVPEGISLTAVPERTLTEMLLAGELDAVIAAHPPDEFEQGTGQVVRLFSDYRAAEEAYYRETGIFPIMHVLVIHRRVYEKNRWIARELLKAFTAAKDIAFAELRRTVALSISLPWVREEFESTVERMGPDFWAYGIEPNRTVLSSFIRYAHAQGLIDTTPEPEDLFAPETGEQFII